VLNEPDRNAFIEENTHKGMHCCPVIEGCVLCMNLLTCYLSGLESCRDFSSAEIRLTQMAFD
jgi:hypothetical protein